MSFLLQLALFAVLGYVSNVLDRVAGPRHGWLVEATCSAVFAVLSVLRMAQGNTPRAVLDAAISGWFAYGAWKRRPPRQRRPSRVLGRVRDLGHRLAVAS